MSQSNEQQTPTNGLYPGEIRLFPFRHDQLPFGWYFCNGERFLLTSPQGEALSGLTEEFRTDWGLEEDLCSISLPNLFSRDGRGCFLRPVDGLTRQVGAEEGDAIRNITGKAAFCTHYQGTPLEDQEEGVFYNGGPTGAQRWSLDQTKTHISEYFSFDASRVVPTAPENRPLNLGMTPAIYLGV